MAMAKVTTGETKILQRTQIASDSNVSSDVGDSEDLEDIEDFQNIEDLEDIEGLEDIEDLKEIAATYDSARVASPSDAEAVVSSEQDLTRAVADGVSTIYIDGSISLTDKLFIKRDADIHMMGGSLTCGLGRPGDNSPNQMITVAEGAKLTLADIEINASGWGNETAGSTRARAYMIYSMPDSEIVIGEGTTLICETESLEGKVVKRGLFLGGYCEMNSGTIKGFSDGGITVAEGAQFVMNGGEITENGNYTNEENFPTKGAGIQGLGSINSNEYGV